MKVFVGSISVGFYREIFGVHMFNVLDLLLQVA